MNDYIQPRRSAVNQVVDGGGGSGSGSSSAEDAGENDDNMTTNGSHATAATTTRNQPTQSVSPVRLRGGGGVGGDELGESVGGHTIESERSRSPSGTQGRSRRAGILSQSDRGSTTGRHGRDRGSSLTRSHVNHARAEHRRARTSGAKSGNKSPQKRRSSSVGALQSHHGRRGHVVASFLNDHPSTTTTTTTTTTGTPRPELERVASNSSFKKNRGYHASTSAIVKQQQESDDHDSVGTFDGAFDVGGNAYALERPRTPQQQDDSIDDSKSSSIFTRRGDKDLRQVDQSVNLMDAEAGNYQYTKERSTRQKKKPKPRMSILDYMIAGVKRTTSKTPSMASMEDIDLGPDPSRRRMTHFYLQQKAAQENDPCHKCGTCLAKVFKYIKRVICSPPFLAAVIIIVTLIFIPHLQDAVNSLPSTPAPAPPTEAPTAVATSPEPTAPMPTTASEQDTGPVAVAERVEQKGTDNATVVSDKSVDDQASSESTPVTADKGGVVTKKNSSPAKTKSSTSFFDRVKTFFSPSPPEPLPEKSGGKPQQAGGASSPEEEARFGEMVTRMVEIQNMVLSRSLTSMQDLHDPRSPQNRALTWLITTTTTPKKGSQSSQRSRRVDVVESGNDDSRTVERYVAAVLFFSFHNASEIEEMHNKLYYAHHYDHVWKESDLWMHGYGFDGLPIGKGSNYSYNESVYFQYYGNYSDYYNKESQSGKDHSDYYQYYYGMSESDYWKYYDEDGNLLWNASEFEEDFGFNRSGSPHEQPPSAGKPKNEERALKGNPMQPSLNGGQLFASILDTVTPDDKDMDVNMDEYFESGITEDNYQYFNSEGKPLQERGEDGIPVEFEQDHKQKEASRKDSSEASHLRRRLGEEEKEAASTREGIYSQTTPRRGDRRLDSLLHGEWMSDKDICEWNGIQCNENHQVVKLCLHQHYLKGRIPSEIEGFEYLKILDLSNNHLRGSIPKEIGSLEYLQELLLQGNKLTGDLPSTIEDHPLVLLRLEHNRFNGTIPIAITTLMSLEELWLNHNSLTGTLPIELERLVALKKLHLEGNRFTGKVELKRNVGNLQTLRLHHNQLSGNISTGDAICEATKNRTMHFLSADCKTGVIICDCCHECF